MEIEFCQPLLTKLDLFASIQTSTVHLLLQAYLSHHYTDCGPGKTAIMKATGFVAFFVCFAMAALCGCGPLPGSDVVTSDAADAAPPVDDGMVGDDHVLPPTDASDSDSSPATCTPDQPGCVGTPQCVCDNTLIAGQCARYPDLCATGNTCTTENHCGIDLPPDLASSSPTTTAILTTTMDGTHLWGCGSSARPYAEGRPAVYRINGQVIVAIPNTGTFSEFWTLSDGHGWNNALNWNSSSPLDHGDHGIHGLLTVTDPGVGHSVHMDMFDTGVDPYTTSAVPREQVNCEFIP